MTMLYLTKSYSIATSYLFAEDHDKKNLIFFSPITKQACHKPNMCQKTVHENAAKFGP